MRLVTASLAGLLGLCGSAFAANEAEIRIVPAIRSFNLILAGSNPQSIESIRNIIVANLKDTSPGFAKSIRFQLDRGYNAKYKKDAAFHKCISQMLAAGGRQGIAKLYKRYKGSSKEDELRLGIAEALGECKDDAALDTLLKLIHDGTPKVAAAAVTSCAAYAKVPPTKRKASMRKLIDRYMKVSDAAAGKDEKSTEMGMYKAVDAAMKETLKAYSGGENLDSALAWDAWWRDNATKKWPK